MAGDVDLGTKHFAALHVLIVDDLFTMREILAGICAMIGFRHITVCDTGREAMKELQAGKFDVIIVDERLQDESGLQLIRAIRGITALSSMRAILITASREHNIAMSAKAAGSDDFLLKPFTPQQLRDRLLRLLPDNC
jgi:two-component system chemotaxis response regulator CheY